jgi:hypothetical protein
VMVRAATASGATAAAVAGATAVGTTVATGALAAGVTTGMATAAAAVAAGPPGWIVATILGTDKHTSHDGQTHAVTYTWDCWKPVVHDVDGALQRKTAARRCH